MADIIVQPNSQDVVVPEPLAGQDVIVGGAFRGETGATGPQGPTGATGSQGPTGPTGPTGAAGAAGANGANGTDGKTVLNGTGAPSAGTGNDGDFYLDTAVMRMYGPKTGGAWGSGTTLVGPTGATGATGAAGADGSKWYEGAGAPSTLHNNGDFYLNVTNGDVYQQAAGSWGSPIANITGPTGATGATGPAGPTGAGKRSATLIVAASDSLSTAGADYVCTGTNDQTTINAAITALASTGGRIVLLEGTYNLAGTISINSAGITLEGQGESTLLVLAASKTADVITIGASGLRTRVKNLKIDGNLANQTVGGHGISINASANQCSIQNCWIINTMNANIYDDGAKQTLIKGNYLDTTKSGGLWSNIEGVGGGARIIGNYCNAGDYANIAIYKDGAASSARPVIVSGNTCEGSGGFGISNEGCWDAVITGNSIRNATSNYIHTTYPGAVIGNTCAVRNNPTGPVIRIRSSDPVTVTGNYILVLTGNTAAVVGISAEVNGVVVTGNTVQFETAYAHIGVRSLGGGNSRSFFGNSLVDYNTTTGGVGIKVDDNGGQNVYAGNSIYGFETGIIAVGRDDVIESNQITAVIGLVATNLQKSVVNGNHFSAFGSNGYGIEIVNITRNDNLSISDNVFEGFGSGTGNYIMLLQGVGYSSITGNIADGASAGDAILITSTGTAYSIKNVFTGNNITGSTRAIKENSANDGPSLITSNMFFATTAITTQNASTIVANNITA